jgi:hypothetical protein
MRELSMTLTLVAALALAGCSDGVKEVKETRGLPARRSGSCPHNHRPPRARPMRL